MVWCEELRYKSTWPAQPTNTYSSLIYIVVGLYILFSSAFSVIRLKFIHIRMQSQLGYKKFLFFYYKWDKIFPEMAKYENNFINNWLVSLYYCFCVIYLGVGSFLAHGDVDHDILETYDINERLPFFLKFDQLDRTGMFLCISFYPFLVIYRTIILKLVSDLTSFMVNFSRYTCLILIISHFLFSLTFGGFIYFESATFLYCLLAFLGIIALILELFLLYSFDKLTFCGCFIMRNKNFDDPINNPHSVNNIQIIQNFGKSFGYIAILFLIASFVVWFLDLYYVFCDPYSIIQGHGFWHLFTSLAIFFFYSYFRSEYFISKEKDKSIIHLDTLSV